MSISPRRPPSLPRCASDRIPRPRPPTAAAAIDGPDGRSAGTRVRDALALGVGVMLDWMAYFLRRWGDRLFAMNDTEAYWRGWQITKMPGGLGRCYRDPRFGADSEEPARLTGLGHHGPFGP